MRAENATVTELKIDTSEELNQNTSSLGNLIHNEKREEVSYNSISLIGP